MRYDETIPLEGIDADTQLKDAVFAVVRKYAEMNEIDQKDTDNFLWNLMSCWRVKSERLENPESNGGEEQYTLWIAAHFVWSSTDFFEQAGSIYFCSILNAMIREDVEACAAQVALIGRAIDGGLAPGGVPSPHLPTTKVVWRGGGFEDTRENRIFFSPTKMYRAPQFLPASFVKTVAEGFLKRQLEGSENSLVLWEIFLDDTRVYNHADLIVHTHGEGEHEFLFTAYSVFTVERAVWSKNATDSTTPHLITIRAAIDNSAEGGDQLALAPWC
jgi:hypothetical protein